MALQREVWLIGGVCIPVGLLGWAFYAAAFSRAPFQDFMVFYVAAHEAASGDLPLLYDGEAFTAALNARFAGWFSPPLSLHPWVYPPVFLLLLVPLGLLPFMAAYGVFMLSSFLALMGALFAWVQRGPLRWVCLVGVALSPATAFTIGTGQNGFMTTALAAGGFGLMNRAPFLAGVLLGALSFKPQLWLMVPVALLAARAWTVLAVSIVTAILLACASLALFGWQIWSEWLTLMAYPSRAYEQWLEFGRLNGQSIYTEAFLLGAPSGLASGIQAAVMAVCAGLLWWCFRVSRLPADLRLAAFLTAAILAAPHASNYDAVMVAAAASLLLCRAITEGFRSGDTVVLIAVWSIELFDPPRLEPLGLITPFLYGAFLARLIIRGQSYSDARSCKAERSQSSMPERRILTAPPR